MTPENLIKSQFKPNNEQLNFIVSCIIGDGHLADTGRLVIAHGNQQKDYCEWKANKLSEIFGQEIKALPTRQCTQIQLQRKFLKQSHYYWYPENNKSISSLLHNVTNPLETIAIWLCDDGNICPSINTKNGKCYSSFIQIFTFTDLYESQKIADWFEQSIGIRPNLVYRDRSKTNRKSAYILKFNAQNSRDLYNLIKSYIPNVESMNYKFRYIEYNLSTRPQLVDIKQEKIV